jgi:hypothetical protein
VIALARARNAKPELFQVFVQVPHVLSPPDPRGLPHNCIRATVPGKHAQLRLETIRGAYWNATAWSSLVDGCAAMILVVDPQEPQVQASRDILVAVSEMATTPSIGVVMSTKREFVPDASQSVDHVLTGTPFSEWPRFHVGLQDALVFEAIVDSIETQLFTTRT